VIGGREADERLVAAWKTIREIWKGLNDERDTRNHKNETAFDISSVIKEIKPRSGVRNKPDLHSKGSSVRWRRQDCWTEETGGTEK